MVACRLVRAVAIVVLPAWGVAAQVNSTSVPAPPEASVSERKPQDLSKTNEFGPLFQERSDLIDEIANLEREIADLTPKVRDATTITGLKNSLSQADLDLKKAQKEDPPNESYIAAITSFKLSTQDTIEAAAEAERELKPKKTMLAAKKTRLVQVEQRIASLFDNTRYVNNFKSVVTVTFGILVLLVIAGFYAITWYKHGVAATIFAGEMGMQFVTLFLIVIAIILFGIMGTLEGRELAALLGGLSGYILGRASDSSRKPLKGGGEDGS